MSPVRVVGAATVAFMLTATPVMAWDHGDGGHHWWHGSTTTTVAPDDGGDAPPPEMPPPDDGTGEPAPDPAPPTTQAPAPTITTTTLASSTTTVAGTTAPQPQTAPAPTTAAPSMVAPNGGESSSQSVEVSTHQAAHADTGGNTSTTNVSGSSSPPSAATANVASGAAGATGSQDSTTVSQQVVTQLSGSATATINQITLVLNIGAAVADSGNNSIATGSSAGSGGGATGAVQTGNATAIGNDSETYLTQGANAQAGAGQVDQVSQHLVTVQIGLASANTGSNAIVATISAGGPAGTSTGAASAVGNQSTTDVDQIAIAIGAGTAQVTIDQRATIVNLGLAYAGTGGNQIGSTVADALRSGDVDAVEQIMALLIPALLASDSVAALGSGSITTGNASAIGNRSETSVQQVAVATSDSGQIHIAQDVTVVNAGIASATTGGNAIAPIAPSAPGTLDPETQTAVSQLSAYIVGLLAAIDAWSQGDLTAIGSSSTMATLGGQAIGLQGSLTSSDTADGSGATVRQLTAVINLARSYANTGGNTTVTTNGADPAVADLAAVTQLATTLAEEVDAAPLADAALTITTGDAHAANSTVIVLCQLDDLDMDCLGPEDPDPVDSDPADPDPVGGVSGGSDQIPVQPAATELPSTPVGPVGLVAAPLPAAAPQLAATGANSMELTAIAVLLVAGGALLLLGSRRRRPV